MLSSLPILDLSELDAGPERAEAFRAELRRVTHEIGFFYLVGHGIPQTQIDELLAVSRQFFALEDADKLSIANTRSPQFRGYTRTGTELTNGEVDWREQLDIGVDRPVVEPGDGVADYWRLEGPNQWPSALPALETAATAWYETLNALALR